jgi:hypothetical protein
MRAAADAISHFGGVSSFISLLPNEDSSEPTAISEDILNRLHLANVSQIAECRQQLDEWGRSGGLASSNRQAPYSALALLSRARIAQNRSERSQTISSNFVVSEVLDLSHQSDSTFVIADDGAFESEDASISAVASATERILLWLLSVHHGESSSLERILAVLGNFTRVYPAAIIPHALKFFGGAAGFAEVLIKIVAAHHTSEFVVSAAVAILLHLVQGRGIGITKQDEGSVNTALEERNVAELFDVFRKFFISSGTNEEEQHPEDCRNQKKAADGSDGYEDDDFEPDEGDVKGDEGSPRNTEAGRVETSALRENARCFSLPTQAVAAVETALEMIASLQPTLILTNGSFFGELVGLCDVDVLAPHQSSVRLAVPVLLAKMTCAALLSLSSLHSCRWLPHELFRLSLIVALSVERKFTGSASALPSAVAEKDVAATMDTLLSLIRNVCFFSASVTLAAPSDTTIDALAGALLRIIHVSFDQKSPVDVDVASTTNRTHFVVEGACGALICLCSQKEIAASLQRAGAPTLRRAALLRASAAAAPPETVLQKLWIAARRIVLCQLQTESENSGQDSIDDHRQRLVSLAAFLALPTSVLRMLGSEEENSAGQEDLTSWVLEECCKDLRLAAAPLIALEPSFFNPNTDQNQMPFALFDLDACLELLVAAMMALRRGGEEQTSVSGIALRSIRSIMTVMRVASIPAARQSALVTRFTELMELLVDLRQEISGEDTTSRSSLLQDSWGSLLQTAEQATSPCEDDRADGNDRDLECVDVLDALTTSLHTQRKQPHLIPDMFWTVMDFFAASDRQAGRYAAVLLELSTGEIHDSALSSHQRERCAAAACTIVRSEFYRRRDSHSCSVDGLSIDWPIITAMVISAVRRSGRTPDASDDDIISDGNTELAAEDEDDDVFQPLLRPSRVVLTWLSLLSYVPVDVLLSCCGGSCLPVARKAMATLFCTSLHQASASDENSSTEGSQWHKTKICVLLYSLASASEEISKWIAAAPETLISVVDCELPILATPVLRFSAAGLLALVQAQLKNYDVVERSILRLSPLVTTDPAILSITGAKNDDEYQLDSPRLRDVVNAAAAFIRSASQNKPGIDGILQKRNPNAVRAEEELHQPEIIVQSRSDAFNDGDGPSEIQRTISFERTNKSADNNGNRRPTSAAAARRESNDDSAVTLLGDQQRDEGREIRIELAKLRRKSIDSANLVLRQEQTLHDTQVALHNVREELRTIHAKAEHERQTLLEYTTKLRQARANIAADESSAALRATEEISIREEHEGVMNTPLVPIETLASNLTDAFTNGTLAQCLQIIDVIRAERAELLRVRAFYSKELQLSAAAVFVSHDRIKEITIELHRATLEAAKHHQLTLDYAKLRRETVDLRNMLGITDDATAANNAIANRFSKPCKTPEEIERTNMQFRLQTAVMRSAVLQKELDRSDAQRAVAELDAVEARQKTKKVLLMHKNDQLGMDWARARMKRLESERLAAQRSLADAIRMHRESIVAYQEEARNASSKSETLKIELSTKIASLESQLGTSQARTIELAGEVRRKDMIISQLSNKLELLRSAPSSAATLLLGRGGATTDSLNSSSVPSPSRLTRLNATAPAGGLSIEAAELKTFFAWKEMRRGRADKGKKK